ncbi:unnamed protein product [Cylindrotheca closterium]|uniref:Tyrosine specific protein phosphatases domain-containing protein n=1 Tax=Cylindrotheca closterium TaxID=2856 RepID=A0AAD2FZJ4_9STRA|nr:unnamed protein product [Cylindrotheca closterium]
MSRIQTTTIGTRPTPIEVPPLRFLIMDAPRQVTELLSAGIALHDMEYADGQSPPKDIIDQWLKLVEKTFFANASDSAKSCIAVHCVAGLGRAPVMVALALIEFAGMDPVEAVSLIRRHRRGAINEKQLLYLEGYKKSFKSAGGASCCVIS